MPAPTNKIAELATAAEIDVAFDLDTEKVGRVFAGRRCHHTDELERILPEFSIKIAVLACRPQGLQKLVDRIGQAGVRAILNFVPKRIVPPPGGYVEDIDISAKLEKLSFLGRQDP